MKKISEYLGRQVINLASAQEEGIIINGVMDDKLKRIYYYVLVNDETFEDEETYLSLPSVHEGADILYITNSKFVDQLDERYIKCPLNARVFNTDGELFGIVKDIEYDEKGYTQKIICDKGEIIGQDIVIATSTLITIKGSRPIRAQRKKSAPPKVSVQEMMNVPERVEYSTNNEESACEQPSAVNSILEFDECIETYTSAEEYMEKENNSGEKDNPEQPPRIISNYNFLLNRKVIKDIFIEGSILISEGTVIDDEVVSIAHKHGKLVELTINSK